jgi:hypothetical protein
MGFPRVAREISVASLDDALALLQAREDNALAARTACPCSRTSHVRIDLWKN